MGKTTSFPLVVIYLILATFIVYECSLMFAGVDDMGEQVSAFGTISTFPILLLLLSALFISVQKSKVKDSVYRSYRVVFMSTYVLTLFWALFYPLNSRIVLFSSFLPICFWLIGDYLSANKREETIKYYIPICFIALTFYFFISFDPTRMLNKEYAAINASYIIIYLLPFILLSDKRIVCISAIVIAVVVSLYSLKRGGMISLSIGILFYSLALGKISSGKLISFRGIIVLVVTIAAIVYLVLYFNDTMEGLVFNRFISIEQDGGSGREYIYESVQKMIFNSSSFSQIVGHGWGGVARDSVSGLSAHNDYLEFIYDFGYIVFFCYVVFLIKLLIRSVRLLKANHKYAPALAASLGIFLANSFVSHIYIYSWYMLVFTFFWGFVLRDTKTLSI